MQSTTAAHTFAQCSRACLRRGPVSTIRSAPARLLATHAAPSLRTTRGPSAQTSYPLNSRSGFLDVWPGHSVRRGFAHSAVRPKRSGGKKDVRSLKASPREDAEAADEDDSGGAGGGGGGATHPQPDPADPFNFADVESRWQRSETHHDEKFKELRRALRGGILGDGEAGAVDVDAIGLTPVTVKGLEGDSSSSGGGGGGGGGSGKKGHANNHNSSSSSHGHGHKPAAAATAAVAPSTVPLSQLALVLPRAGGRIVELRMHNPASRKALMSAHGRHREPLMGKTVI
ncbi:WD repeat protein [Niveomyces insectorum RCEF 264]|uniref:WD repeat protein n=1 Tax=Niveomyces insectorum RCEF 264 TaxID=1081102 RepID=A0A167N083_9HYPO|nr:WD repeat protein [Niveomyces insectorum RCEF 264]